MGAKSDKRAGIIQDAGERGFFQIVPAQAVLAIFGREHLVHQCAAASAELIHFRAEEQIHRRGGRLLDALQKLVGAQKFSRMELTTSRATSLLKRSTAGSALVEVLDVVGDRQLVAFVDVKNGPGKNHFAGRALHQAYVQAHVDLQAAGAAGGLIDQGGISEVVDHGAAQDGIGLGGIVNHLIAACGR